MSANFNSHARVGRDAGAPLRQLGMDTDFNSHARVGRDPIIVQYTGDLNNFNSHARVGRDYDSQMHC